MKTACTATRISKTPRNRRRFIALAVAWFVTATLLGACASGRIQGPGSGVQSPESGAPILILISLDGWRWDYVDRARVPRLRALAKTGVRSEGLIPPFPSKTFPSHYSIVTGLYPEHHGIVSNNMVDDAIGEPFSMSAPTAKDSRWWAGEPLWVTAEKQGQIAASMFWPGSEVEIGGERPTHWRPYDHALPHRDRIQEVLRWLRLPERERPSFITLYFSDVDSVGHSAGPESMEILEAAAALDRDLGVLFEGVTDLGLEARVHYVIVSDHGMSQTSMRRVVILDDYIDVSTVDLIDSSPVVGLRPRIGTAEDVYRALKDKHPSLAIYRRADIPAELHYNTHPRIPPVIGIAADGWTVTTRQQLQEWQANGRQLGGNHGYDPRLRSMHGLFIAAGSQFRQGVTIPPFENIHLYEMMARVLGLNPAPNDGRLEATAGVFRSR